MEVYIVRHAIAAERGSGNYPNDDRPLTPEGMRKMKRAAQHFPELIPQLDAIYTSPLTRARETASIVAASFDSMVPVEAMDELLPGRSAESVFNFLNEQKEQNAVLLVGHEPELSKLVSVLLGSSVASVEFKKGSLCSLSIAGAVRPGSATLRWLLQPKHLRALNKK